jgi:transposase
MRDRELYATILGLRDPWHVDEVDLDTKTEEVRVHVAAPSGTRFPCPECGEPCPGHDHRQREWRHLDTCQFRTILVAKVPRVNCAAHGVRQIAVPWAEPGSGFTALFEAVVIDWLREAAILAVARRMRLTWDQVAGIQERAVRRGLARRKLGVVEFIGVDETSFRRRHDYVTGVTDLVTGDVLHTTDDRKRASLDAFYDQLTPEQRAAIQAVAMDMHKPYIASTRAHVPDAERETGTRSSCHWACNATSARSASIASTCRSTSATRWIGSAARSTVSGSPWATRY